jgi:nucleoside-triphosphatase THEP1
VAKAHPVADRIKARPEVQVQRLTPTNSKEVVRAVTADLGWWLASAGISC